MSKGRRITPAEQPEWMATVVCGDVLKGDAGALRIVRHLSRSPNGALRCVTFAIRRVSWTRRATTTLNFTDLQQRGYRPTGVRVKTLKGAHGSSVNSGLGLLPH